MDFSKAFDKVDHSLLIYKLFNFGVNLKTVSWIKSFLLNRNQSVVVKDKLSDAVPVLSGVLQGSVFWLGTLFISCIQNDLLDSLKSRTRLSADDTVVYLTIIQIRIHCRMTCTSSSNGKQIGQWNLILINVK